MLIINRDEMLNKLQEILSKMKEYLVYIIVRRWIGPYPTTKRHLKYFYRFPHKDPKKVVDVVANALKYVRDELDDFETIIFGFDANHKPYIIALPLTFEDSGER